MRTAGLPTFKKLYRIIKTDLNAGTYSVIINNCMYFTFSTSLSLSLSLTHAIHMIDYPVSEFSGGKYIVLSTVSWMGGKNPFLGV